MSNIFAVLITLMFAASSLATAAAQDATEAQELKIKVALDDGKAGVAVRVGSAETEFTLPTSNRDIIIEEIAARTNLTTEQIRKVIKFENVAKESELEIEAEAENGATKVKLRVGSAETEFTLPTSNRDIIIEEIAARTNLTTEQIRKVIKFEKEFKKKIDEIDFPVKKRTVVYQLKEHLVGMDAVIAFAEESDKNTTELKELRAEFNNVIVSIDELLGVEGRDPLGSHVSEARRIAGEFREASHGLLEDQLDEARKRVKEAISEDMDGILAEEANKIRAEQGVHDLQSFDSHVENAQRKIDRLASTGFNVDAAQTKLDEIKDKRLALEVAIDASATSCLGKPLKCDTPEHDSLKELRKDIRVEFKELNEITKGIRLSERISHQVAKLEHAIERAEDRLEKAEEKGLDVTVYKAKLEEVKRIFESANEKAEEGDVKGALADLRSGYAALTNVLKELAKDKRELLKELRKKKKTERVDELAAQLEKTAERAEKLIDDAEGMGLNVADYRSELEDVKKTLAAAKEKAGAGKLKDANKDLHSASNALTHMLKELAKDKRELLKELRKKKKHAEEAERGGRR